MQWVRSSAYSIKCDGYYISRAYMADGVVIFTLHYEAKTRAKELL